MTQHTYITITQAPEGWWNAQVVLEDGTSLLDAHAGEGLPSREAADTLARATVAQYHVSEGRYADVATWGW